MSDLTPNQLQGLYGQMFDNVVVPHEWESAPGHITHRAMVLDLAAHISDLNQRDWSSLSVAADVLLLPKTDSNAMTLLLKGPTTIFARRVVVEDGGSALLFAQQSTGWRLDFCAGRIEGRVFLSQAGSQDESSEDDELPYIPITLDADHVCFSVQDGVPPPHRVQARPPAEVLAVGGPAHIALLYTQIAAWILMDDASAGDSTDTRARHALSGALLDWLYRATITTDQSSLALQAASMKVHLAGLNAQHIVVPYLSEDVYRNFTEQLKVTVGLFEQSYKRFADRELKINERIEDSELMKTQLQRAGASLDTLIEQQEQNVAQLIRAVERSQKGFNSAQAQVSDARIAFEQGVDAFKEKQRRKAFLAGMEAVIAVGVGIAAIGAGQPQVTAAAAVQVGGAAAKAAQVAQKASKLAQITKKLMDVAKQLAKLTDALQKVLQAVKVAQTSAKLNRRDYFKAVALIGGQDDGIMDNTYWDVFKLDADDALAEYTGERGTNTKISGAAEFRSVLVKMSIYGKAMYQNQQSLVQALQEQHRLEMHKADAESDIQDIKDHIKGLKSDEGAVARLQVVFYARMLAMKSWLAMEIAAQGAAYRYWSLSQEALRAASVTSKLDTLAHALVELNGRRLDALRKFRPAPQDGTRTLRFDRNDAPGVIDALRESRDAQVPILLDDPHFEGDERVRFIEVRAYVNDDAVRDGETVQVEIETNGSYADRLAGATFQFSGDSFPRRFDYQLDAGRRKVVSSTRVADEFEYSLFKPTLFTVWNFSVTDGVDVSKIETLEIEFDIQFSPALDSDAP